MTFEELKQPAYKALQPFGQIPSYQHDDLVLFESGAIVFHIAQTTPSLLPTEPKARARAIAWMFAALNTVEPPIVDRSMCYLFERDKSWYNERIAQIDERVHTRLKDLSAKLGENDWLDGAFSAGDLLVVSVLRRLESSGILAQYSNLANYIARAEKRPAYQRAFAAQLEVFQTSETK